MASIWTRITKFFRNTPTPAISNERTLWERLSNRKRKTKIAIIGFPGVGKSTLINGVRNIFDENDKNYAKASYISTSNKTEHYKGPKNSNVYFIEIHCTASTCNFDDIKLLSFDHIVIVVGDGFTETDLRIASYAEKNHKSFSIVRMKLNHDIESKQHRTKHLTVEEIRQEIRDEIINDTLYELDKGGLHFKDKRGIYLVSYEGFRDLYDNETKKLVTEEMDESRLKKKLLRSVDFNT